MRGFTLRSSLLHKTAPSRRHAWEDMPMSSDSPVLPFRTFRRLVLLLLVASALIFIDAGAERQLAEAGHSRNVARGLTRSHNDWPTYGGNLANERYSTLTQISRATLSRLSPVWHSTLDNAGLGAQNSAEGTPIVVGGVMYISTGSDDVFALDASTGRRLWRYSAHLASNLTTACCGLESRGVAVGAGKVFVAQLDGRLRALNEATGVPVWTATVGNWRRGYTMTLAPLFYGGSVFVGVSGGDVGIRGFIAAYRAGDGKLLWRFNTVPRPGQKGSETWARGQAWKVGGGPVWDTPAVDPRLRLLYAAVANPGPTNGHFRAGRNLFTDSVVALDIKTGALRWFFQAVHHDIWDYDCATPTVLFDFKRGSRVFPAVAAACKTGWLYILDRRTGNPLIPISEKAVPRNAYQRTSPTQPIPTGDPFVPQCASSNAFTKSAFQGRPYKKGCVFTPYDMASWAVVKPSALGGANWPPMSFSPATGFLYVCAVDRPTAYTALPVPAVMPPGVFYTGAAGLISPPRDTHGTFTAIRASTNRIVWQKTWPDQMCYSGSLTTASGIVFVGRGDQGLVAYDASNGANLWQLQTPGGANAPPIAYAIKGREYLAFYAGGNAQRGPHSPHTGGALWALALKR